MARAFIIVIDSLGCGWASDADRYDDAGADTLGHIAQACARGLADAAGRSGPLRVPTLASLGLTIAAEHSTGRSLPGVARALAADASAGCAYEASHGKDTLMGHWEIAGAPLEGPLGYLPRSGPSFPEDLVHEITRRAAVPGLIGLRHGDGLAMIEDLGEEHVATGKPIIYTSADSVIQIAAHEEVFGRDRLYRVCELTRELTNPMRIGRIIARPFTGPHAGAFRRTSHRRDYPLPPPKGNVLDRADAAGRKIISVGKIGDIFAHRATGRLLKGRDDMDLFDQMLAAMDGLADGGLLFANFVDLDTNFGHRRDVAGYAAGLERLDARLPAFLQRLHPGDLCIVTADHGNDPTWTGSDHTRENVPVLQFHRGGGRNTIGRRATFADVGATVATHLRLGPTAAGVSWLDPQ